MQLTFEPPVFGGKNEVPVSARATVIAPVGNCRIVSENCVERDLGFVLIAEILCPSIDLFLTGGIPGHFAAEWVGLLRPVVGAFAHLTLQSNCLCIHAFEFEVG